MPRTKRVARAKLDEVGQHAEAELAVIHRSVQRSSPLGSAAWVQATAWAWALGLTSTLRPRGRPKGEPKE
ncbi:MAG: hypothetical protein HYV60_24895 [Planctomycetia bacterium]|nr:hypothetical protein [Planctomycetia bacterium]